MHKEAYEFIAQNRPTGPQKVLDLGSREAGAGRVRDLFTDSEYVGFDAQPGPGVDHICNIADVTTWKSLDIFTVVICAEVFEHEQDWPYVCDNAWAFLEDGGTFLVTAAGKGRPPHTCLPLAYTPTGPADQDGGYPPNPGEHYANILVGQLESVLWHAGFTTVKVESNDEHGDVYAKAVR